jgi:hypothetical protein
MQTWLAMTLCRACEREEEEDDLLLTNQYVGVGCFVRVLGWRLGLLLGCCWAAEVHGGKSFPLSILYFLFYFLFYIPV